MIRQRKVSLFKSIIIIIYEKSMKERLTCWCRRYNDTAIWNGKLQNWWKLGAKFTTLSVSVLMKFTTCITVTKHKKANTNTLSKKGKKCRRIINETADRSHTYFSWGKLWQSGKADSKWLVIHCGNNSSSDL